MSALIRSIALLGGIVALTFGEQGRAGGDYYDAATDFEGKGPVYFGFVRDTRGASVAEAQVQLRPKQGEPVLVKTNAIGMYRSHIRKGVSPDEVEVSCEKEGYKLVRVVRRNPPGSRDMNIETSCTLQRQ
jgi:hypothetical protein